MKFGRRNAAVLLTVVALAAGACGDDDDETASPATSTSASADETEGDGASELRVTMLDYAYELGGELAAGTQVITSTNDGEEFHMMGVGRLKEGKAVADVQKALQSEDESAFGEVFEEEIGTPGHILFPGTTQQITLEEGLDVGSYAIICFLPTEGEGTPHFAKGMLSTFEVVEGADRSVEAPEATVSYSLPDREAADGPTEVEAGEVTFEVTNDGELGKDFIVAQLDAGKDFDAFDEYFTEVFEGDGPPPKGAVKGAPGKVVGSTFEISPGQTVRVTVQLTPGTWQVVNGTNLEGDGEEETDDQVLEITVS